MGDLPRMNAKARWALALVLMLAAGLRGWAAYEYSQTHPLRDAPTIDEASYDQWAVELASGDWMGDEVFFQEPLYPYFLGLIYKVFGRDLLICRLIQAALGVLSCYLVAGLGRRLAGDWAGVLAALFLACLPSAVLLPCLLLKPNLHLPLFCALALALSRPGPGGIMRWFAIGLLGALCALLRGNSLVLLGVFFAWSIVPIPRGLPSFVRCFSFVLGAILILGPVAWRNHEVGGVYALTTSGAGTNLYGGNYLGNPKGVATELPWVRGIPQYEAEDWRNEAERRTGDELDPTEVSRYWLGETLRSFVHNPGAHARIFWNKLRATLGFYPVPDNHSLAWDAQFVTAARLPVPGFGVLSALGLAGCLVFLLLKKRRDVIFENEEAGMRCIMLLGLYVVTIVLTVTSMRARMPLSVLLAPIAAAWAISMYRKPQVTSLLIAGATGAFVAWPLFSEAELSQDLAERDYNLIVQELREGEPSEGTKARARNLVSTYPDTARFRILQAELHFAESIRLGEAGDEVTGMMEEQASLRLLEELSARETLSARTRMSVHRLAGWVHTKRRDWPAAELNFRRAREFDPEGRDLLGAHAQALVGCAEESPKGPRRDIFADAASELLRALDPGDVPEEMSQDLIRRLAELESE